MNKAIITAAWIVNKDCDRFLSANYYVAITTEDGINYRTRSLNTLNEVDSQLKRLSEGLTVSLSGLQQCDSTGYILFD